ncbi:MAG: 16S rRNA (uracil(1498)-N(3))-methyltransferase, partial [Pseudomonadota bacterium]|nr:16S rRNA (uracil(1498)-N(3))-methyltransferase [Pseudomonadota bacterium]
RLRELPFCSLVSLGPRILRAETAAIAALACWQSLAPAGAFDARQQVE